MPPLITSTPVRGVDELNRAFAVARQSVRKEMKTRLRFYAEPVRRDAETLATAIGAGPSWSRMRTGATPTMGYVAPVKRGTQVVPRRRPGFAPRLLRGAMIPALNKNRRSIGDKFDEFLGRVTRQFGRGR